MKSNEEFIAGIYEKAAAYTEEKETKIIPVHRVRAAKAARVAAMLVLCLGLAGIGTLTLGKNGSGNPDNTPGQTGENYGIALTSETGEDLGGTAQLRIGPVAETVTFTGVVERVDAEENRIWLTLVFDKTAPEQTENSVVCIKWDVLEPLSETIAAGVGLTATGALSVYENEASEYNGCAELVLTDIENLEIEK